MLKRRAAKGFVGDTYTISNLILGNSQGQLFGVNNARAGIGLEGVNVGQTRGDGDEDEEDDDDGEEDDEEASNDVVSKFFKGSVNFHNPVDYTNPTFGLWRSYTDYVLINMYDETSGLAKPAVSVDGFFKWLEEGGSEAFFGSSSPSQAILPLPDYPEIHHMLSSATSTEDGLKWFIDALDGMEYEFFPSCTNTDARTQMMRCLQNKTLFPTSPAFAEKIPRVVLDDESEKIGQLLNNLGSDVNEEIKEILAGFNSRNQRRRIMNEFLDSIRSDLPTSGGAIWRELEQMANGQGSIDFGLEAMNEELERIERGPEGEA
jgi:hypothetical protein